jgi:predicted DCC family thiol-disulfide oxidoreductase YuxK
MKHVDNTLNKVLYFDGVCNLCNGAIQFTLKRNKKQDIYFASLQSEIGQVMMKKYGIDNNNLSSLIFVENGIPYTESTGALKVTKYLNGLWPLMVAFLIVPKFIRDSVYKFIAKNRYKWFGKQEVCWLPTPELKNRFLD